MSDTFDRRELLRRAMLGALAAGGGFVLGGCSTSPAPATAGPGSGPRRGGSVIFATAAEETGFNPATNAWDSAGLLYARTVYDPLFAHAPDGSVKPYLAESITPNEDYTRWVLRLRPGITFHDGSVLDAEAVKSNLDASKASPLVGSALANLAGVTVIDSLSLACSCSVPWVPFPNYLTEQLGFMAAPSYLANPDRAATPVGTGPFVFSAWVPGSHFSATRNPTYWRPGLPYLDSITYRPIIDTVAREDSLLSGTVDLMHSSNTQNISDLRRHPGVRELDSLGAVVGLPGQHLVMLNTAVAPTNDLRVRRALAAATDRQRIIDLVFNGLTPTSDSPFPPGSADYGPTPYPAYNPAAARADVASYEADHGPLHLSLGTVNTAASLDIAEVVQSMWAQVGVNVDLAQFEQAALIENALKGSFQAYIWSDFNAVDPDGDYNFWASTSIRPVGQYSLNYPRNRDPLIDAALRQGRSSPKPAVRAAAYRQVADRLAVDLPYLWITRVAWIVATGENIEGMSDPTLPDGSAAHSMRSGVIWPSHLWRST